MRVSPLSEQDAAALFIERARAACSEFTPDGSEIERIAELCRRLDRLPLAIELAAARVRAISITEKCARVDERFRLLGHARRGASSRQQSRERAPRQRIGKVTNSVWPAAS